MPGKIVSVALSWSQRWRSAWSCIACVRWWRQTVKVLLPASGNRSASVLFNLLLELSLLLLVIGHGSDFATTTGWQRFWFCPPSKRKGGAGPGSPREKPNLHRQGECAVKCSYGSVLSVSPFSTILLQYESLAKAHGHCLCNIAHFASARCIALLIRLTFPTCPRARWSRRTSTTRF